MEFNNILTHSGPFVFSSQNINIYDNTNRNRYWQVLICLMRGVNTGMQHGIKQEQRHKYSE